jgi:hypothetical protein
LKEFYLFYSIVIKALAVNADIIILKRKGARFQHQMLINWNRTPLSILVAERMGFEPMMEYNPHTRLAGERLQPARPSLLKNFGKFF